MHSLDLSQKGILMVVYKKQKTKNIYVQAFSKDVPEAAAEALLVAVNR